MEKNKLNDNLDLILKEEYFNSTIDWEEIGQEKNLYNSIIGLPRVTIHSFLSSGNFQLVSNNYDLLKSLFSRLNSDEQKSIFYLRLEEKFVPAYVGGATKLALLFLMKERSIVSAVVLFQDQLSFTPSYLSLLGTIYDFIRYEHRQITNEELDKIKQSIYTVETGIQKKLNATIAGLRGEYEIAVQKAREIGRQIHQAKFNRLKDDLLEGINFEINQDRETLKENLRGLDFDQDLIKSIDFVDNMYRLSDNDFTYKACADQLRSFTSGIVSEIAKRVALIYDDTPPQKDYHKYLKEKNFF